MRFGHGLIGLAALAVAATAGAAPVRWEVANGGNGHLYEAFVVPAGISWADANAAAQAIGPGWHLATITSAEENAFVFDLVDDPAFWDPDSNPGTAGGPWLGAFSSSLVANDWQWVTGEPFVFTNWASGQPFPNGDALHFWNNVPPGSAPAPTWNDTRADFPWRGYVAEVPEPSTCLLLAVSIITIGMRRTGRVA